jgi:hypothetical protein
VVGVFHHLRSKLLHLNESSTWSSQLIDHASPIILDHGRSLDPSHISRKVPTSPDLPERENLKW